MKCFKKCPSESLMKWPYLHLAELSNDLAIHDIPGLDHEAFEGRDGGVGDGQGQVEQVRRFCR